MKKENLQLTGAFKIRGAYNKLATLKEQDEREGTNLLAQGVICASAGNHAQGVAYSAQCFKTKAVIVMPENTPLLKVSGTKAMGAEVVLVGNNYDESYTHALKLANIELDRKVLADMAMNLQAVQRACFTLTSFRSNTITIDRHI